MSAFAAPQMAIRIADVSGYMTPEFWLFLQSLARYLGVDVSRVIAGLDDLREEATEPGKSVVLSDGLRFGFFVWDPDVTPAEYGTDPEELTMIAPVAGQNGAWVDILADYRMGSFANSVTPAIRQRLAGGQFIGDAAVRFLGATHGNNGATEFWVHDVSSEVQADGASYWVDTARNIFERDNGLINLSLVTRDSAAGGEGTIGLVVSNVQRSTSSSSSSWAIYSDMVVEAGSAGRARNGELNIVNKRGAPAGETPYSAIGSPVYVLGIAAGGDSGIHGATFPADYAIRINNNGATDGGFKALCNVRNGAIVPDGSGEGPVFQLPGNAAIGVWYRSGGTESGRIVCNVTGSGPTWKIAVEDDGIKFSLNGAEAFRVEPVASAVNRVQVVPSITTQPVTIKAEGTDTDIGVTLAPKGTGTVTVPKLSVGANQVVGARATGWAAATGTATRTTFATGSVTTAQLAERVKALIDDLTLHGLIGS